MNLDTRNALAPKYSLVRLLIRISVIAADKVFCMFSVVWNRAANLRLRSWKQYCAEQNTADFRSRSIKGSDFGMNCGHVWYKLLMTERFMRQSVIAPHNQREPLTAGPHCFGAPPFLLSAGTAHNGQEFASQARKASASISPASSSSFFCRACSLQR